MATSDFDPYQALEHNLKSGDRINRWVLRGARQKIVQILKGQRVLDVGCGTGNLAALLAAAGCQVTGVDGSPTMLSHARQKRIAAEFKRMDAATMPFRDEFEAAVISSALHEMSPGVRGEVWEAMRQAVIPGGKLIALDFAIPLQNNLLGRMTGRMIEQDERSMLKVHPEHYENYREFMQSGGLLGWIQKQGQPPEADYRFWGGSIAVIVVKNQTK